MTSIKKKKILLQYSYLCLEKEDVFEICKNMEPKIREYLEKNFKEEYDKKIPSPKQNSVDPPENSTNQATEELPEDSSDTHNEQNDIHQIETIPKNKNQDIKKLYRKIVEKTHPDKVGSNHYADVFSRAAQASKNNNLLELIKLASMIGIVVDDISDSSIAIMEENVSSLEKQILIKKNTLAWSWYKAKSDEERNKLVEIILSQR